MRDMVTCFSEHAVRISETTCSSIYANHDSHHQLIPCTPPPERQQQQQISCSTTPANQTAVTSLYKITLSNTRQHLLVTLTWSKRNQSTTGHNGLTITFSEDKNSTTTTSTSFKILLTATSRLFRKKKGTKSLEFNSHKIDIIWDLAEANYYNHYNSSCVEPVDGYYLIVMVDSEVGLMLGDLSGHEIGGSSRKMDLSSMVGRFTLVSRKEEHYYNSGDKDSVAGAVYSTKARFVEGGDLHEIVIRCCSENKGLSVSVDKSMVMRVKRLQWNFRGNQTVFVDGLLVDLFWDVHDWFFGSSGSTAVFMFRKRCGVETRLWLQQEGEKLVGGSESNTKRGGGMEKDEFSLLIYANKSC